MIKSNGYLKGGLAAILIGFGAIGSVYAEPNKDSAVESNVDDGLVNAANEEIDVLDLLIDRANEEKENEVYELEANDLSHYSRYVDTRAMRDYLAYMESEGEDEKNEYITRIIQNLINNKDYRFVYSIINMYGYGINEDFPYVKVLESLVFKDDYLPAFSYLADHYIKNSEVERGLKLLVRAGDRGDARSLYILGKFYAYGNFVEKSDYYSESSLNKVMEGSFKGKARYIVAQKNNEKNEVRKYLEALAESASTGYKEACVELADLYGERFKSLDPSGEKRVELMLCAYEGGESKYSYELGELYYDGYILQKNLNESFIHFEKYYKYATENKIKLNVDQFHKIAVVRMRFGSVTAVDMFKMASNLGNKESSYVLGKIYESGAIESVDLKEALRHYKLSYEQGREESLGDMENVKKLMEEKDWHINRVYVS